MKLRTLVTLVAAALVATSAAAAATDAGPGPGQGQGKSKVKGVGHGRHGNRGPAGGQACRGRSLLLGGLYVSGSAGADGTGSFVLDVQRTSRLGKQLGLDGKQVTVSVDARTRIRRGGPATLADLQANDRVGVVARACKPAAASDAPTILGRLVVAHAPVATLAAAPTA